MRTKKRRKREGKRERRKKREKEKEREGKRQGGERETLLVCDVSYIKQERVQACRKHYRTLSLFLSLSFLCLSYFSVAASISVRSNVITDRTDHKVAVLNAA